jgi:hypothetical protein
MSQATIFTQKLALMVVTAGISIAMIPDEITLPIIFQLLYSNKYISAELAVMAGLLFYLSLEQKTVDVT